MKEWILRHPKREQSMIGQSQSPGSTVRDVRSCSAPAPPPFPDGTTSALRDLSRSISPQQHTPTGRNPEGIVDTSVPASKGVQDLSAEIVASQAAIDGIYTESNDITQASDRSQEKPENSDSPIIVSETSLKRKRSVKKFEEDPYVHKNGSGSTGSVAKPLPIKNEQISSPASTPHRIHVCGTHDSLDLDDVGDQLITPRKRQQLEQMRIRQSKPYWSTTTLDDKVTLHAHPGCGQNEGSCSGSIDAREKDGNQISAKGSGDLFRNQQQAHNDRVSNRLIAVGQIRQDDFQKSSDPLTVDSNHYRIPQDCQKSDEEGGQLENPAILRPTDANADERPRTSAWTTNQKRACPPSHRDPGAAYVPAVAEDGENNSPNSCLQEGIRKKDARTNNDAHHRLGALLNNPSPTKSLLTPSEVHKIWVGEYGVIQETSECNAGKQAAHIILTPGPRPTGKPNTETDTAKHSVKSGPKMSTPKPASHESAMLDKPPEIEPNHEPLRARPLKRLRLDDFKLNPAHSDYAYHESIRKHDEKKALSGCTDPTCPRCKDMRRFVEQSGYATSPRSGQEREEADRRLLEDFLGEDRRRLRRMPVEEKERLLKLAKTKQFADRFGKHRQAFPRAKSPPGYWEIGMPTTQEEERNREAATVLERQTVEERYHEAHRQKGRYIFADEKT